MPKRTALKVKRGKTILGREKTTIVSHGTQIVRKGARKVVITIKKEKKGGNKMPQRRPVRKPVARKPVRSPKKAWAKKGVASTVALSGQTIDIQQERPTLRFQKQQGANILFRQQKLKKRTVRL